jgi:hypothetical protein
MVESETLPESLDLPESIDKEKKMTHSSIEEILAANTGRNAGSHLSSLNEAVQAGTPFVWDI